MAIRRCPGAESGNGVSSSGWILALEDSDKEESATLPPQTRLFKPFTRERLGRKLREVLGEAKGEQP